MIKGDREYDYFYEVDGERTYDTDAEFGRAELFNYAANSEDTEDMDFVERKV